MNEQNPNPGRMTRALGRLLWLAVADGEGCGCEAAAETGFGVPWTAPLCEAVRCLGLGDHFDAGRVEQALYARDVKS